MRPIRLSANDPCLAPYSWSHEANPLRPAHVATRANARVGESIDGEGACRSTLRTARVRAPPVNLVSPSGLEIKPLARHQLSWTDADGPLANAKRPAGRGGPL